MSQHNITQCAVLLRAWPRGAFLVVSLVAAALAACGPSEGPNATSASTVVPTEATKADGTAASTAIGPMEPSAGKPFNSNAASVGVPSNVATSTNPSGSLTSHNVSNTPVVTKSISEWAACDGMDDESSQVAKAFDAAKGGAFTLVVDCVVRLQIGMDISKPIFIDNNTTVEFSGAGKFIVDNVFQPAFVIADAHDITLSNWNIEYDGGLPVEWDVGGYDSDGKFYKLAGYAQPAFAFTHIRLASWLATNRQITFDQDRDPAGPVWAGPTNTSAMFFVTGDVSNLSVTGMTLYVPPSAGGNQFIPMAFSLTKNYRSGQSVSASTPVTAQYMAIPHNITFDHIHLDGTYMGWQGSVQGATFSNIESLRYGDLQNASGGDVGGIGKWFAPPHLFYLNYDAKGDPGLVTENLVISNVVDDGRRVGVARDKGGADTISGYASSLKLGCLNCSVTAYKSFRPDGFLDLLPSAHLTVSDVEATYDSSFLNNIYPGWRYPSETPYNDVSFRNITLTDVAEESVQPPMASATQTENESMTYQGVKLIVNRWAGSGLIVPKIAGSSNIVTLGYVINSNRSAMIYAANGQAEVTIQAMPDALAAAQNAVVTWSSTYTSGCTGGGAWQGAMQTRGSISYAAKVAGNQSFALKCQMSATQSVSAALPVTVVQ